MCSSDLFFQAEGIKKFTFSQLALAVFVCLWASQLLRLNHISLSALCVVPSAISPNVSVCAFHELSGETLLRFHQDVLWKNIQPLFPPLSIPPSPFFWGA